MNALDLEIGGEDSLDVLVREPMRALLARLIDAEALDEGRPTGSHEALQGRDVGRPILWIDDMEAASIKDEIKRLRELRLQDVVLQPPHLGGQRARLGYR